MWENVALSQSEPHLFSKKKFNRFKRLIIWGPFPPQATAYTLEFLVFPDSCQRMLVNVILRQISAQTWIGLLVLLVKLQEQLNLADMNYSKNTAEMVEEKLDLVRRYLPQSL
mgnify:CR=1 FL=1